VDQKRRLRYAVFGEHRYCPVCGLLPPSVIALDGLAAETARLDALAHLPADIAPRLREQGVFNRMALLRCEISGHAEPRPDWV